MVDRLSDGVVDEPIKCLDGARASPPEDCGGPHGYADRLAVLMDKKHPEHGDVKEWLGPRFNPEKLDLAAVNKKLAPLSRAASVLARLAKR